MSATNRSGKVVNVGNAVSIVAKVVSVSGSGSLASVTCQAPLDAGTFVITANDANAVQEYYNSKGSLGAVSLSGKNYGAVYDDLTVMGVVTAISGSGQNAVLTVTLKSSGNSIHTAAGNVYSDNGNIILPASPPTPVFLSVNPGGGAVAGGTPFTITGMNFVSGASVSIGGNPATGVVVVSSTEITAVSPAGMAQGLEDINIVTPNGSIDTPFAWVYANSYVTDSVDMTLNAAQIIALSTPLQLIAGMAGMIPIVESGFLVYTPGTSPFVDQPINLYVGSGTGANALENYTGVTGLFTQTLPVLVFFNPGYQSETNTTPVHTAIPESVLSGSGINLAMPVGTSGGNGTLRVFLEYSFVEA